MIGFAVKISGMALVAASAVFVGNYMIFGYKKRIKELEALKKSMVMFKNEILYSASTLEESFANIAKRCTDEQIASFFDSAAQNLAVSEGRSARQIWEECIYKESSCLHLNDEDITELKALGSGLGYLDSKMQTEAVELYLAVSEIALRNAEKEIADKCKVTRVISMACGAFICILLL